ncbi:hypothetical protein J2I47_17485 [Fibrella sp. HMF5335]|uniref:Uncharacterized protein n=1 Tax=Fibrella rubiginis TaxID=2817060 RepID=A0A939K611_9BACT|nr:three component ABC system middle component [Fibrella rubiginis]MBO0938348.1 hypothetical protein [Fibrella rubiginis]
MITWNERPGEIANLLNPAFCSLIVKTAVVEYYKRKKEGISYPLAFIILPLVLHKNTREALPATTRTKFYTWLQNNQQVRIGLDERVNSLSSYTKETLMFAIQHNIIKVDLDGLLLPVRRRLPSSYNPMTEETLYCINSASLIGKWLADVNDVDTLFSIFGIKL